MKSIAEAFDEWLARVSAGVELSPVQRHEMRRSFYAGYAHALEGLLEVAGVEGQKAALEQLEARWTEVENYLATLAATGGRPT